MAALARLWSARDERPVFVAAAFGLLGVLLAYPFVDYALRAGDVAPAYRFWDFGEYNAAVERWWNGGSLYLRNDDGGFHGTYLYPPFAVLLFWPFTWIPSFRGAAMAWCVFSVALLWVGLQLVAAEGGLSLRWWERGLALWALLGFQPLLLSLKLGQTAAFTAALLTFAFVALSRGRRRGRRWQYASGAATAFVGALKLAYAPVGAHLLANRDRFVGAVAAGVAVVALSVAVFGVEVHGAYLGVLRWGLDQGTAARSPALWLPPYYQPLAWIPGALVLRLVVSGLIAGSVLLADATADAERAAFAAGVAAFPLLSPQTYTYYFVALLPAFAVLLAGELRDEGRPTIPLAALFLVQIHAYGLKALVDVLPAAVPAMAALEPAYPLLQPGLWGNLLFVTLGTWRVLERTPLDRWRRGGRLRSLASRFRP